MGFRKLILYLYFCFIACIFGENARASEILNNLYGQCGEPVFGQFECDSDSIRITYDRTNLINNGWINSNASPGETFISGPVLNLDPGVGSFKSIQVTGIVKIYSTFLIVGHLPLSCLTLNHIFDIVLTATDELNNTVSLLTYPVNITNMFRMDSSTGFCTLNGAIGGKDLYFPFLLDFFPEKYKNFQIKINNLTLSTIHDSTLTDQIKIFNFLYNPYTRMDEYWYLQLLGIR